MIIAENIQKTNTLVVDNLAPGDTFVILTDDFDSPFIMTNMGILVDLISGGTFYSSDCCDLPVRKIDFKLIQRES